MRIRKPKGQRKSTCSKCGILIEPNRLGKYAYCLSCHNKFMRDTRPKHSELTSEKKMKANCRSYLNVYLGRGKIKKLPCCVCGDINSQAHHEDYSKPLDVIWYCRVHHNEIHKQI